MTENQTIDLRGLQCPTPIVRLNEEVTQFRTGDDFFAVADDRAFEMDIAAWCEITGNELLSLEPSAEVITAHIRKS